MDLKCVWNAEMDILDVVDCVCRENGLRYSLAYGTMLGAVRHGGFIPWDDDMDIIMPREDYEKLLNIWDNNLTDGYIIQNKDTNWDFTQNFSKVRKDHSTFIHNEWEKHVSYHTGIFIDVFPGDRIAPNKFYRKMQILASAVNLLLARGYTSKSGGIQDFIEKCFLKLPERVKRSIYGKTSRFIQKWNKNKESNYFFPNTMEWAYKEYPSDMFEHLVDIPFENRKYMCIKDANNILSLDYGDYLRLPPEEERVLKHHPVIVDNEHNLNEILGDQS